MTQLTDIDPLTGLPPKGYRREQVLAERTDDLAQTGEERAAATGVERMDPKVLEPDREIQYAIGNDELTVLGALPQYAYCWVYTGLQAREVWKKKLPQNGNWEVVSGPKDVAPEAWNYRAEDGTRRIGDTILMRTRIENKIKYDNEQDLKRRKQQFGITGELEEMGAKHRKDGIIVHTDVNAKSASGQPIFPNREAVTMQAGKMVEGMVKNGTVPGMPVK